MIKKTIDQVMPRRKRNAKLALLNEHIEEFFTDTEYLQNTFESLLVGPDSLPRVLNIHAPYLMGKSALLAMLYLTCISKGTYVALADARRAKTPQDILRELADQLEDEGVPFKSYRRVLNVVLDESKDPPQPFPSEITETPALAKGLEEADNISKSASPFLSAIPVAGPVIVTLLAGISATGRLLMFWKKKKRAAAARAAAEEQKRFWQEIRNVEPFRALREAFNNDLKSHVDLTKAEKSEIEPGRSVVLMLDHFEQVLDPENQFRDWVSELANDRRILIVLASRRSLGPDWSTKISIQTEALAPMEDAVIGELVRNYCKARAIPSPSDVQVMNIVKFAARVPHLAVWGIEICRDKRVPDWDIARFLELSPGVALAIGDLLEGLLKESTESKSNDFSKALEAAAIVRWFSKGIFKDLAGDLADRFYPDLERLPVVLRDGEYLSIRAPVREVINRKLRSENPERYFQLHLKASESYERRLKQLEADPLRLKNKQTLVLENLYHKYQFEPDDVSAARKAEQYFQTAFMDAFNRRQFDFCESLLRQVTGFDTSVTSKDWVKFYRSLMNWYRRTDVPEARQTLEELASDPTLNDDLLAYLYEVLGWINWYDNDTEKAKLYFKKSLDERQRNPNDVLGRIRVQVWQGVIYQRTEGVGEQYLTPALDLGERLLAEAAAVTGARDPQEKEREQLRPILGWAHLEFGNSLMLQGRFEEAGKHIQASMDAYKQLALRFQHGRALMTYGRLLIYQGKLKEAEDRLLQSTSLFRDFKEPWTEAWAESWLGDVAFHRRELTLAEKHYAAAKKKWTKDEFGASVADGGLAEVAFARREFDQALEIANQALEVKTKYEDPFGIAWTQNTIGNALLAKNDDMGAEQVFEQGLQAAKTYGSFLAESLLGLGKCRLLHFRNDESGFNEAAKSVEVLAREHSFLDLLAQILYLRATLQLRKLAQKESAWSDLDIEELTEMLLNSLTTALGHNVFMLYDLLGQTIKTLRTYDEVRTDSGPSLRTTIVQSLRNRWKQTKIDRKTLEALEKHNRAVEVVDQRHCETVLDRLKLTA